MAISDSNPSSPQRSQRSQRPNMLGVRFGVSSDDAAGSGVELGGGAFNRMAA